MNADALLIDVVPLDADGVQCEICQRSHAVSVFELSDGSPVRVCSGCVQVLRTSGMAGLQRLAQQRGSAVVRSLPATAVIRILEVESG